MTKRLSDQLADLSVRAKGAEQALDAAEKEAHDKIVARKEQAHAAATKAVEKVNQEVKSANDTANRNWSAVKAKVAADASCAEGATSPHDQARARREARRKAAPTGSSGRQGSPSTTPSRRSNRRSWPFSTPSTAASRRMSPVRLNPYRQQWSCVVKIVHIIVVTAFALGVPAASNAQVAGSTFLGASYAELRDVAVGWSAKRQILGPPGLQQNRRAHWIDR